MQYYYSAATNGFYVDMVHFDAEVPDDLQPINEQSYLAVVGSGAGWTPGPDGLPVPNPMPVMPVTPADPDLPVYSDGAGNDSVRMVKFTDKFGRPPLQTEPVWADAPVAQSTDNYAPRPADDAAAARMPLREYGNPPDGATS